MKILFTSVGRRVELIQAFRAAAVRLKIPAVIFGADISDTAPALFFCDRQKIVCRISNPDYIPTLLKICADEKIDLLIPTIDTDLLILAENKKKFADIGTRVVISDADKIAICRNKRKTYSFFVDCGLKSPITVDDYKAYTGGFPAFIKPKDGSSSINAYRVDSLQGLEEKASAVEDYIVQPYISGKEYTVDIFCDFFGNPIYITPRERLSVRSGEVLITKIMHNEKIIGECKKIIKAFCPCGNITVQLIEDKNTHENYYIEINPRFGGGAPLGIKSGADSAEAILRLAAGKQLSYCPGYAVEGEIYSRFDQSICVKHNENFPVRAAIFDLDDTLYPEKQYVKCGFDAVANVLCNVENAREKLWGAFLQKKNAIDHVLEKENLNDKDLKAYCLEAYRNNTPILSFYPGIKDILISLKNRGVKLGVITDGRPNGQRAKIKALALDSYFDEIIITDELGGEIFRKPDDISFRIMLKRFGVEAKDAIYIGDNAGKDKTAAHILGMRFCHVVFGDGLYSSQSDDSITSPAQILKKCGFID